MVAANMGELPIVQYLIEQGADLAADDLGKKNDGPFGASIEPLMPVDYAIGVGTFVPNNAVIMHDDVVKYRMKLMQECGLKHTTPAEVARMRKVQTGNHVDGIMGGLAAKDAKPAK
jgi:hypothetical protein